MMRVLREKEDIDLLIAAKNDGFLNKNGKIVKLWPNFMKCGKKYTKKP